MMIFIGSKDSRLYLYHEVDLDGTIVYLLETEIDGIDTKNFRKWKLRCIDEGRWLATIFVSKTFLLVNLFEDEYIYLCDL